MESSRIRASGPNRTSSFISGTVSRRFTAATRLSMASSEIANFAAWRYLLVSSSNSVGFRDLLWVWRERPCARFRPSLGFAAAHRSRCAGPSGSRSFSAAEPGGVVHLFIREFLQGHAALGQRQGSQKPDTELALTPILGSLIAAAVDATGPISSSIFSTSSISGFSRVASPPGDS